MRVVVLVIRRVHGARVRRSRVGVVRRDGRVVDRRSQLLSAISARGSLGVRVGVLGRRVRVWGVGLGGRRGVDGSGLSAVGGSLVSRRVLLLGGWNFGTGNIERSCVLRLGLEVRRRRRGLVWDVVWTWSVSVMASSVGGE